MSAADATCTNPQCDKRLKIFKYTIYTFYSILYNFIKKMKIILLLFHINQNCVKGL